MESRPEQGIKPKTRENKKRKQKPVTRKQKQMKKN